MFVSNCYLNVGRRFLQVIITINFVIHDTVLLYMRKSLAVLENFSCVFLKEKSFDACFIPRICVVELKVTLLDEKV